MLTVMSHSVCILKFRSKQLGMLSMQSSLAHSHFLIIKQQQNGKGKAKNNLLAQVIYR